MTEVVSEHQEHLRRRDNENPWYLLATLYGEPKSYDEEARKLEDRNRNTWNRYMAGRLDDQTRARLIEDERYFADELTPFTPEEINAVEKAFEERKPSTVIINIFDLPTNEIDFSETEFSNYSIFERFLFPVTTTFANAKFSEDTWFKDATFSETARFKGTTFSKDTWFEGAAFSGRAVFEDATFSETARFERVTFPKGARFKGATFSQDAGFYGATFSEIAVFEGAKFSQDAWFKDATFSQDARFKGATFSGSAVFEGATFSEKAIFRSTIFEDSTFDKSKFCSVVSFVNAEMKGLTSFSASFEAEPPDFFGAKLHEGTNWYGAKWPSQPRYASQAVTFVQAYERLKLEMDRLRKHEDELNFFAREMQSRQVRDRGWRGLTIALYGLLSDYGRSYVRPLYGIFATALVGSLPFWMYLGPSKFKKAFGLSLTNTFGAFGFRRDFISAELVEALPSALKFIAAIQTILGGALLFLFGLALRNSFRMK